MYHSVDSSDHFFNVLPEDFERQMCYLRERGFNIVSLDQLAEYRKAGKIPRKTIAVTFDDGYLDNYTHAFPVLQKYSIPASIFVITDTMTHPDRVQGAPRLPMLTESLLIEMDVSGLVSIEPHTVTHPKLTKISEADVEREVRDSRVCIEKILHKKCAHFAYPKGRHNEMVRAVVARDGIENAYIVEPGMVGPQTDSYLLNRNSIDSQTTFTQFKSIVRHGRMRPLF